MTRELLLNYGKLMSELRDCFETSVPYDVIAGLVHNQLSGWKKWDVRSTSVTGWDDTDYCYSMGMNAYVMKPDMDTVENACKMIEELR